MTGYHHTTGTHSRGFTLIEVLVTMLILAVGLLGLAGLQTTGLRYNVSAYQRTQATVLANDILDRMRSNRAVADTGGYNTRNDQLPGSYSSNCLSTTANCTPADLASHDIREWKTDIENTLPGGQAQVTSQPASGTGVLHTIAVQWIDDRNQEATDDVDARTLLVTVQGEL